jgi:hypothetical protein
MGGSNRRRRNGLRNRSSLRRCNGDRLRRCGCCRGGRRHGLGFSRLFYGAGLFFARCRRRNRNHRRLDDYRGRRRRHHYGGPSRHNGAGRGLGDHSARWRTGRNRRRSGWRHHDGRCGARLRHDPARFRPGWRCRRKRSHHRNFRRCRRSYRRLRTHWCMALPSLQLFLLLVCENRLQHIARFGDMRQIDLGLDSLWRAGRCGT